MKLNRTNLLLIGLLIAQIVIGAAFAFSGTSTVESSRGPLFSSFTPEALTKIAITDGSDKTKKPLTILKTAQGYVLPDFDNYPADASKISTLASALSTLDTRRLIAQNKTSQNRLKVAPEAFDRQLALHIGDKDLTLFLGTANEANAAYARLGDSDAIYLPTGLSVNDVSVNPVSWVNPAYVTLTTDDIVSLTVVNSAGSFAFKRENGNWMLADSSLAAGESLNTDTVNSLVTQLGSVSLSAPLGSKVDDKFGMAKPNAVITIQTHRVIPPTATPLPTATGVVPLGIPPAATTTGATPAFEEKTLTLQIGAKLDSGDYVLKSSESAFYVQGTATFATSFIELNRAKVVKVPPTLARTNTPFGPLAPPTSTATQIVTATPTVTNTPTATP